MLTAGFPWLIRHDVMQLQPSEIASSDVSSILGARFEALKPLASIVDSYCTAGN